MNRRRKSPFSAWIVPITSYPSVGLRHPPAVRLERAVNDLFGLAADGSPDRPPLARSRSMGRALPAGRPHRDAVEGAALSLPAGARRRPASDRGRPGACRHHRTRAFSFYRKRGDRGPAGAAAGIHPQGYRGADDRRRSRARRGTGRTGVGRQHGGLCLCIFAGGRGGAGACRAASRSLAAGPACRTRAACQPSRRRRRDLQRCVLCADARALQHIARERAARLRQRIRPSVDAGYHRTRRRGAATSIADGTEVIRRRWPRSGCAFPPSSNYTTTPHRCRIAPSIPVC